MEKTSLQNEKYQYCSRTNMRYTGVDARVVLETYPDEKSRFFVNAPRQKDDAYRESAGVSE